MSPYNTISLLIILIHHILTLLDLNFEKSNIEDLSNFTRRVGEIWHSFREKISH